MEGIDMWYVVDKDHNIVVASSQNRKEARASKRSMEFMTGRKYRVEQW
jgi:hypothetical protein